ncbi:uncharacterized protein LOC130623512 [Hydractinia symbiolongicarpus]|uniref:uncharacterized protein LOC130623512 n=1 Tax=Hydractinia symbiolongicarpus TaxID=13093 RepID=UPI00254FE315|nr:uncharacterized protein LOC130623512 [Hydractinia symbiolongicarpus]
MADVLISNVGILDKESEQNKQVLTRRKLSNKSQSSLRNKEPEEKKFIDENDEKNTCDYYPLISKATFTRFHYGLYFALLVMQFLPTVYKTVRIFYLGDLPKSHGVNIASQLIWINLILEVFQEGLILPLYNLIGEKLSNHVETKNRVRLGIIITFIIHLCLAVAIGLLASPLTKLMAQDEKTIDCTIKYVRLELISIPFESVNQFVVVLLTMLSWQKHLYVILVIRVFMSIVLDTFFLSNVKYSLQLGVNGIAYGNIAIACIICVYSMTITITNFHFNMDDIFKRSLYNFNWLKSWVKVGFFSGLDSFIRNIFYILCVIRMMNVIKQQGVYWRANEFIWNWLLLPYIPLTNLLKQDTGHDAQGTNHRLKMSAYMCFTIIIFVIWTISIPLWKLFFHYVMNVEKGDVNDMYNLVLMLSPFYLGYMINTLFDSVLYGKGKTWYLAIQSGMTNLMVNLPMFILFLLDVYKPTVHNIALVFGGGIMIDAVITTILYFRFLKLSKYLI